jgi:hypothetical protein
LNPDAVPDIHRTRRQLTIILVVLLAMTACLDVKNMNRKMDGWNKKGTTTLMMPLENLIGRVT